MELAFTYIQMEWFTKGNLKMIRKQDTGFTNGLMEECMRVTGTKESNMGLEFYSMIKNYISKGMACGKTEKE
jgi:hypothetical protein